MYLFNCVYATLHENDSFDEENQELAVCGLRFPSIGEVRRNQVYFVLGGRGKMII